MKQLVQVPNVPTDAAWWKNDGHGRRLVCSCATITMLVLVNQAFCVRCRTLMQVLTASPNTAARLERTT